MDAAIQVAVNWNARFFPPFFFFFVIIRRSRPVQLQLNPLDMRCGCVMSDLVRAVAFLCLIRLFRSRMTRMLVVMTVKDHSDGDNGHDDDGDGYYLL